jgi:hypothetical protein
LTWDTCYDGQQRWISLANTYNHLLLTHESDRHHAIKGVISTLERKTGLRFVSGTCETFFPIALLWTPDFEDYTFQQIPNVATTPLVPSWSGALVRQIKYSGPHLKWKPHVTNSTCYLRRNSILYLKAKSYVRLQIRPSNHQEPTDTRPPPHDNETYLPVEVKLENWTPSRRLFPDPRIETALSLDQILAGPIVINLVLLVECKSESGGVKFTHFYGLMATKDMSPSYPYHWRRIGAFSIVAPRYRAPAKDGIRESILAKFGAEREFEIY